MSPFALAPARQRAASRSFIPAAPSRALRRSAAILCATLSAIGSLFVLRARFSGRPDLFGERADRIARRWAQRLARAMQLRIRVDGALPEEPVAIVANHLSYLDIVALWCVLPGAFVARADVAGWPLIGLASRLAGTISIDRARRRDLLRVVPELSATLASRRNVIFFPEATSSPGEQVLQFHSALFEAAARLEVPVVGVSLQYETVPPADHAASSVAWWGGMAFVPHLMALLAQSHVDVCVRIAAPIEPSRDRKTLCKLAREIVVKNFLPTAPIGFTQAARSRAADSAEAGAP